jgi:hypothetical protein
MIAYVDASVLLRVALGQPNALLWKETTGSDLVMATHDGALALGAQAHGLVVVGVPRR